MAEPLNMVQLRLYFESPDGDFDVLSEDFFGGDAFAQAMNAAVEWHDVAGFLGTSIVRAANLAAHDDAACVRALRQVA